MTNLGCWSVVPVAKNLSNCCHPLIKTLGQVGNVGAIPSQSKGLQKQKLCKVMEPTLMAKMDPTAAQDIAFELCLKRKISLTV